MGEEAIPLRQLVKDLSDAVNESRKASKIEHEGLKTYITQKFDGDGGLNEGVIPSIKRHNIEIAVLQQERLQTKPKKEGIMGWLDKHEKTIKYILILYLVLFHPYLVKKIFP